MSAIDRLTKLEKERFHYYKLDGHEVVPCASVTEWAEQMQRGDRQVACAQIGRVRVSTVFLGIDHSWGHGPPLLFETMVFGGVWDGEQERYSTWEEAEKGHQAMLKTVRGKK